MIQRIEGGRSLAHGVITDLAATISEQISRGVTSIQMDASRVVEFDSQSLEGLLEFNELAKTRGLSFLIIEPSEVLMTALSITGLQERLEIAEQAPMPTAKGSKPGAAKDAVEALAPTDPAADGDTDPASSEDKA